MKVFVYAFHKTGSMFLYRYFKEMAVLTGNAYFSVNNTPKDQNEWRGFPMGFIVCPIRYNETNDLDIPQDATSIIHMRNPIDVLISQYFSFGWTHATMSKVQFEEKRKTIQSMTVDEYCLSECVALKEKYQVFLGASKNFPRTISSSYSDMHGHFKKWNAHICSSLLGDADTSIQETLYKKFKGEFNPIKNWLRSLFPRNSHRRDGSDGQMSRYLKPETIKILENEFIDIYDQKA